MFWIKDLYQLCKQSASGESIHIYICVCAVYVYVGSHREIVCLELKSVLWLHGYSVSPEYLLTFLNFYYIYSNYLGVLYVSVHICVCVCVSAYVFAGMCVRVCLCACIFNTTI